MRGHTVEQLREDIDTGKTGSKVSGSDPAAAPLGADDEAAGFPPSTVEVALAKQAETQVTHAPCHMHAAVVLYGILPVLMAVIIGAWVYWLR